MVLFLLLVIAAIALGIVGVVVKGLFWLLIIGIVVILVDLILVGVRMGRRRRVTADPLTIPPDRLTIPLDLLGIRSRAQRICAASSAVRGPTPRLSAASRPAGVSTSERRLGTSVSPISAAPPSR